MTERIPSREPVMKTTAYDKVSSFLMAVVSGLTILVFVLVLQLQTHEPVQAEPPPQDFERLGGNFGNDKSKEPAGVPSPEDQPENSYFGKVKIDIEELLKQEIEGALQAKSAKSETNPKKGKPGGGGPGTGPSGTHPGSGPGDGDRWFIAFNDEGSMQTYAKQLDFFNIEMAYFNPGSKTVTYVKNFSQKKPSSRVVKADRQDKRFAFLWQNKGRRAADVQLLKKAGIDVGHGVIVHFYPSPTVQILARVEVEATNRSLKDIRRTYFGVRPDRAGFKFIVTRISYLE